MLAIRRGKDHDPMMPRVMKIRKTSNPIHPSPNELASPPLQSQTNTAQRKKNWAKLPLCSENLVEPQTSETVLTDDDSCILPLPLVGKHKPWGEKRWLNDEHWEIDVDKAYLMIRNQELEENMARLQCPGFELSITSDEMMCYYSGLPSINLFNGIMDLITPELKFLNTKTGVKHGPETFD